MGNMRWIERTQPETFEWNEWTLNMTMQMNVNKTFHSMVKYFSYSSILFYWRKKITV